MFNLEKMLRGQITCIVDKVANFILGSVDASILPIIVGQSGYSNESVKLVTTQAKTDGSNLYEAGFDTFSFNMTNVLKSELTIEGIKSDGYYRMDLIFADDVGNQIKLSDTDYTGEATNTTITLEDVTTTAVICPKHNIGANYKMYYNLTFVVDKQFGRIELRNNGQILGYVDCADIGKFGNSHFSVRFAHKTNTKTITVRQVKVQLSY